MALESRKQAERDFHNSRIQKKGKEAFLESYPNLRFYRTVGKSSAYVEKWFRVRVRGKKVLDYCCGAGGMSRRLAQMGAQVVGIDIANENIAVCREEAKRLSLKDTTSYCVMDAENTSFEPGSFDYIYVGGCLHHLDLPKAYRELARLLKSSGEILCQEALSNNPLIHAYRKQTPHLRTAWEVDHILAVKDIESARSYFNNVDIRFFHLASLLAIPLIDKPGFQTSLAFLNLIDDLILRIPYVQRMAWQAIFTLSGPV